MTSSLVGMLKPLRMHSTSPKSTARLHSSKCRLVVKRHKANLYFTFQSAAREGGLTCCLEVNLGSGQLLKTKMHPFDRKYKGLAREIDFILSQQEW